MKILFISPSFYPATYYGGPIYSTYGLAKALKKTGVNVRIITTNANGNEKLSVKTGVFHKLENELPVKYYWSLDSRGTSLSMILNLKKEIKNSDVVYLVSIFSPPTPFVIRLCRSLNKPLIISPRGQLGKWCLEQGNKFKKLWLRLFILSRRSPLHPTKPDHPVSAKSTRLGEAKHSRKTKTEQLVSAKPDLSGEDGPYIKHLHWHLTSEEEKKEVLAIYPSAKTFIIPNGVSSDCFTMNVAEKDRSFYNKYSAADCSKKKIIISLSRIHKKKGYDILIEAFDILIKQKSDCLLFIAGEDFGERQKLDWMIGNLGLREKVFLIGRIEGEEKISFLHNADVFALPSHNENFGMVYAEALAAGTPVVASTNTPWQDVENFKCGKWVANTPGKFADAIKEILNSDPAQMGRNGSKFIKENFSWEKIATDFLSQTEKIIGKMVNAW